MTREDLAYYCLPLLTIAIALKADIGTPDFPDEIAAKVSWLLTGVIGGLTPICGPIVAGVLAAMGRKGNTNV